MKGKRILSIALTVAMLLSMSLPLTARANEVQPIKAVDGIVNENNAAFLWTGTWADQSAGDRHGGASKWTNTPGSAVEILFEGQGISFYSTARTDAGEYEVYLDGVYQGKGSLKGAAAAKQVAFSVFGLTEGVHRLKICTVGAVILEADAAQVLTENPGLTTSVAVTSAGDAEKISDLGATLQMTAATDPAGTPVKWTVTDDKGRPTSVASIDKNGLLTAKTNGVVLVRADATDGTLKSAVKIISISGQTVEGETWDDQDAKLMYSAGWAAWNSDPSHYNGTTMYSTGNAGDTLTFSFTGTRFKVIGLRNAALSSFSVSIDGTVVAENVSASGSLAYQQELYASEVLSSGKHNVVITDNGQIYIDAIEITYAPPQIATITAVETLAPIEVSAGTAFKDLNLPDTVSVTAGGVDAPVNVYWEQGAYNAETPGSYSLNGVLFYDATQDNPNDIQAAITVTVTAAGSAAPRINAQPQNQSVAAPAGVSFTVEASSPDAGTLTYQWQKFGVSVWEDIEGARSAAYAVSPTTEDMNGAKYRCVVTNTKQGSTPSSVNTDEVTLTVMGQQSIALDTETGRLKVDYASYLSRHDVVYKSPVEEGVNGATVGTGRMGGMVWNKDGLKLEVTNVDAAPYSSIPSGLVTYQSSPMPNAVPGAFEQRLNLHAGSVTTEYGDGLEFTIMGDPDSELMGIHVVDGRETVTEAYVDLSLWLDKLNAEPNAPFTSRPGGNPAIAFPNQATWLNPKFTVRDNFVAITRGQEDPNNFGYTIALSVEGAEYTAELVGAGMDKKLRLNVDPADKEYTIWIANPSRRHADNHDTLAAAESMLAQERTYDEVYERFTAFWDEFWSRCFAEYQSDTDSDADYLENSWYLYQYLIGCGSRGEFPFHFMNGVWRGEERDEGLWSWDYTSFNERTFAYTHYATNRLELTDSYYDLFYNNLDSGKQYTIDRFWNSDKDPRFNPENPNYIPGGVLSPERHTWNGEMQVGYNGAANGCPYTTKINATAAEHAMGMYERYAYTGDLEYLETKAYPFIKAVGIYLLNFLQYDSATDTYYSENSHALEQYWGVMNPITDLAAFPALFERAIAASELLNVDPELRAMWQVRLEKLAVPKTEAASGAATAISGGANRYQPHDPPRTQQKNSQNPELDVVWPYSRVGLYQESTDGFDFATALNSYLDRKMPINIWTPEPIVSARLGLGDESFRYAVNMIARSQTRPNGIHYDGNGSFESNALVLTAVGEELLQSYNDKIVVFPAVMSDPTFHSKFTLLARGGFLVSSEYEDGNVKYIALISQLGGKTTVVNPWGEGEAVTVRNLTTNEVILQSVTTLELSFDTVKDGKYVVEQDSRPLSAFTQADPITAPRNEAPKYLTKSGRILGSKPMDSGVPITTPDVIVNEDDGAFRWNGTWTEASAGDRYGNAFRWSGTVGSSVDIAFEGEGILLYSTRRADGADYEVYLDGAYQGTGSVKGATQPKYLIFSAFGLADGEHVLTLRHSAGSILEVDAAKVPSTNPGCVAALSLAAAGGASAITAKGGTLQLTATVDPANSPLKWTVTDLTGAATSAAEIDQSGLLTAKTNGLVRATAAATDTSFKSASVVIAITGQTIAPKVIASAASVAEVSAAAGTVFSALNLPQTVGVTLVGGGTAQLPVLWLPGEYDPAISAKYAITGTLLYGADYENPDRVSALVNVVLGAQAPAILAVSPVAFKAGAGTAFQALALPETVTATVSDGATVQVAVVWDSATYDPSYVGTQYLTGELIKQDETYTNPSKLYATAVLTVTQRTPEEVKLENKIAQARAYMPAAAKYKPEGIQRLDEAISSAADAAQSGEALEAAYLQLRDAIFGLREVP